MNILLKSVSKFSSRNCWHCMPNDFFSNPVCAGSLHMVWFQISQHICHLVADRMKKQATKGNKLFSNQNCYTGWPLNYWMYGLLHTRRSHIPSPHHLNFEGKINLQKLIQCTFLNILYPKRRCSQIFLLALTAHHTESLMSDNRNLCYYCGYIC